MLVLLERLGNIYKTPTSKRRSHQAIYECICGTTMQLQMFEPEDFPDRMCRSCAASKCNDKGYSRNDYLSRCRWSSMKQRCFNSKSDAYKYYGARGITVYKKWVNNFPLYLKYVNDLDNAYVDGYSIDRIDNDGNYEPGNIKWSTKVEQMNNKRQGNQHG